MGSQPSSAPRVLFGPFEYDQATGELRKQDKRVRLTGQPIRILHVLLENGNQVVSREELQQRLWQGTTFGDFEHGLNAAINKLRHALADSADQPRYIETVPGRGYRFIAALSYSPHRPVLEMVSAPAPIDSPVEELAPVSATPKKRAIGWAAASLVGLAVVTIAGLALIRLPTSTNSTLNSVSSPVRFRVPIPQGMSLGESQTFSLSPDGRTLVYTASIDGKPRLWAQFLDELEPRVLSGTDAGSDAPVFWSPDSKHLVFNANGKLLKMDLSGNPPEAIGPVPSNVIGGSWSPNGTLIFGTGTTGLLRMDAKGGEATPITARSDGDRVHVLPVFLPDGRHFLYSRQSTNAANMGVYVGSLDETPTQKGTRLIATPIGARFVASEDGKGTILFQRETTLWAREFDTSRLQLKGEPTMVAEHVGSGRAFGFFAVSNNVLVYRTALPLAKQMTWVDRTGRRLANIAPPADLWEYPRLSPDGKHLAVTKFTSENTDVWIYDLSRGVMQRVTRDPSIDEYPVWSPDGSQIVFTSARAGHNDLYQLAGALEGGEKLLYSSNDNKIATSWSRDGRFLLYTAPGRSIWALPLQGSPKAPPVRLTHADANEGDAAFSPDSHWIAFVSGETGTSEVYVEPFRPRSDSLESGPKILVSRSGGFEPHWRADGKEILYRSPDGSMMSVAVTSQNPMRLGVPQMLFHMPGEFWDVTADASRFVVEVPIQQEVAPFTVVLNWQASLKK